MRQGSSFLRVLPGGATSRRTQDNGTERQELGHRDSAAQLLADLQSVTWLIGQSNLSPGEKFRLTDRLKELGAVAVGLDVDPELKALVYGRIAMTGGVA